MFLFLMGVIIGALGTGLYLERAELRRELKQRLKRFVEEDDAAETSTPVSPAA